MPSAPVPRSLGGPELGGPALAEVIRTIGARFGNGLAERGGLHHHVANFMLNDVLPPNRGQL